MSKYSKLFSIFTICVLTLVGFIIYQSQGEPAGLKLELVTAQGQAAEIERLQLIGHAFNYGQSTSSTPFEFQNGSISYMEDNSLIETMDSAFNTTVNRYILNYRSFMRGKARQSNLFTETDEYLLYTGMRTDVNWQAFHDNSLTLSLLDKETKEEMEHEVILNGGPYQSVVATYLNYPHLTIVTQGVDDNMNSSWPIYSFDLNNPEIELTPVQNLGRTSEANTVQLSDSKTKTGRYILFRTVEPGETDDYGSVLNIIPTGYYVYDTQAEEVKEIPTSEEDETLVLTDSETVLVGNDLGNAIEWSNWDVNDESLTPIGTSDMVSETIGRVSVYYHDTTFNQGLQLINDRIYAFEQESSEEVMTRPLFQVIDQESLDTVFSGSFNVSSVPDRSQIEIEVFDYTVDHYSH